MTTIRKIAKREKSQWIGEEEGEEEKEEDSTTRVEFMNSSFIRFLPLLYIYIVLPIVTLNVLHPFGVKA